METVISQPRVPGDEVVIRKSASYHPTVWGDYFILQAESSPSTQECVARVQERAAELMEQVRSMFKDTTDILQTMDLVDSIQLLGLSYHFEKEISGALKRVHDADLNCHGLYETALRFRLLRQEGYHVTPVVFNKFKDEGGSFMSTLGSDVKGLLSLYNAAYLGTHGEIILDEAISFTRNYLVSSLADLKPPLKTQVSLDLETPLCRRMRRLLARDYISIYQEDATRDDAILELAKLDFNLLQSLHLEELENITKWWNDLAPSKHLSFARDRLVECYFWILGIYFEPYYSRAREITTKVIALISILDDIYDVYSTLEESQRLTEAIQRWDVKIVHQLPEYMKDYYLKLMHTFKEFEDLLASNEKYRITYLKEAMKDLSEAYFEESKWRDQHYVPTLDEHLHVSLVSSTSPMLKCAFFVGMGEIATKEAFEWITSFPKIVQASAIIGRIMNDIASHELEQTREHVASTVQCYMKEYGTDVHVACKKLQGLVDDAWKEINEECLNTTAFSIALLERIINYSRMAEITYKYIDGYTNSSTKTKEYISLLLVHPVPL
ncbi:alpha-humulene synthase-like isoform X1 [Musa acuminata AAA Group]|uniref:alpha-humulene synthase-like isoform X1 n=1 Tax=Musa acuminata AAA Group TaxID=214697 RepID=UPI0031D54B48